MTRTILHVDMDAFYASVEQRDHPEFRGKPVIVGSDPKGGKGRGIVATCSYEARKFGIRSAQPISRAWRLCPEGIYVRPDMDKYVRVSDRVMNILGEFSDQLEQVSVDEAFLDVTESERLFGSGIEIATTVRTRIRRELCLTASVGVAANKFVAKVASDLGKPDGLVAVEPGREAEFLAPLPIGRLWGVGPKTEVHLKRLGLHTIGQLAQMELRHLQDCFGKAGAHLWQLAQGIDDRAVSPDEESKSIGHEMTFERDTADVQTLHHTLLELTEKVARRLRSHGARARTVGIKFREADFTTCTRRKTLSEPVDTAEKIFPAAWALLNALKPEGKLVRLIGVYGSNLDTGRAGGQLPLFTEPAGRERQLAAAMDDVIRRFGSHAITRAALVPTDKQQRRRRI